MLLAAAERRLGKVLRVKADELIAATDADFALLDEAGQAPGIAWGETPVAVLMAGATLLTPEIRLDRAARGICETALGTRSEQPDYGPARPDPGGFLVPVKGLEPPTPSLRMTCSTS